MNKDIKKIRCISCPEGCMLKIYYDKDTSEIISASGHKCRRGTKFAEDELKNPVRILTTTIAIDSKKSNRLPVRSSAAVPKSLIMQMIKEIKKIKVAPPVKAGDILADNFLGSGSDIISSATFKE